MLPDQLRQFRNLLKANLYTALGKLGDEQLKERLVVEAGDELHHVEVVCVPASSRAAAPPMRFAGNFFSPLEMLVWQLLGTGPRKSAVIAGDLGIKRDGKLTFALANLVERDVLVVTDDGYARAPLDPPKPTEGE